jgi:hypothetical protein
MQSVQHDIPSTDTATTSTLEKETTDLTATLRRRLFEKPENELSSPSKPTLAYPVRMPNDYLTPTPWEEVIQRDPNVASFTREHTRENAKNDDGEAEQAHHEQSQDDNTLLGRPRHSHGSNSPESLPLPVQAGRGRANHNSLKSAFFGVLINFTDFLSTDVSILVICLIFVVPSALFLGIAWKTQPAGLAEALKNEPVFDRNFFNTLSQFALGILANFAVCIPLWKRDKDHQPDMPVSNLHWFTCLICVSISSNIIMAGTAASQPKITLVFGWIGVLTQLVATFVALIGSSDKITKEHRKSEQLETENLNLRLVGSRQAERIARDNEHPAPVPSAQVRG